MSPRGYGPGRVNLIGDHTDYNQGLAMPIAVNLGTEVTFEPDSSTRIVLTSTAFGDTVDLSVEQVADPVILATLQPPWSRTVAGLIAAVGPTTGGVGSISSTLPIGAGLSSSAALGVALCQAFDVVASSMVTARICQRAEQLAGVPVGIMDPLVCAGGLADHGLLIDFATLSTRHVPIPHDVEIVVVHSGQTRSVGRSGYAERVAECQAAAAVVGPLGTADEQDLVHITDPLLRRRAQHVVSECGRVRAFAGVIEDGDLIGAGALMRASHASLAENFEVSTTALDALVAHLESLPGVHGARMTGAGFGGCVVALCEPGAVDLDHFTTPAWRVVPCDGMVVHRERALSQGAGVREEPT